MQLLTSTVATAFAHMGVPAELVAWVLADIARPQGVDRLLTACADVRLACLVFQARPDAPMVVQVVSSSTEVTRPAFVLLDLPAELVACVLSKIERPEDVNRLLATCQAIRRVCLVLQGGEGAGADAPMVVQVVSISNEATRTPSDPSAGLCMAVKNGWVALLPLLWTPNRRARLAPEYFVELTAGHGQLGVLQWPRAQDPPLAWGGTCEEAALNGHRHVLAWAREQADPAPWGDTCGEAALCGHLHVLAWARGQADPAPWGDTCPSAAFIGNLDMLKWARGQGAPWGSPSEFDLTCCSSAASSGHLDVLKWAHAQGAPWSDTCSSAAIEANLDVLKWARAHGAPWDNFACAAAARVGHLHMLEWAHLDGAPWGVFTCSVAARAGRLEVLQWARMRGARVKG